VALRRHHFCMSTELAPHYEVDAATRASVARELARFYAELSSMDHAAESFSIGRYLRALAFGRGAEGLLPGGREADIARAAAATLGQRWDANRAWFPLSALHVRTMTTTSGSKGGYMLGGQALDAVDVLRPWSIVAGAGAQIHEGLVGSVPLPRVTAETQGTWIGEAGVAPSESPPTMGEGSLKERTAVAFIKFSVQLLRQAEKAEMLFRAQLLAAVGAMLDAASLAGAGGIEPLGLSNTPGVGTQSGASLAHAGLLAMRKAVVSAGGREDRLLWVGAPNTQETLGARERAIGGGRFLWDDGFILGRSAFATKSAPAGTLFCGDFSQMHVGLFGPGIRIDVDPSQDFNSAGLVARVMLMADVAFAQPAAFVVAKSVT
jgi:HK97 family phage major capsid protein